MELVIGETKKYKDKTFRVVKRENKENSLCPCIGCIFSRDDTLCNEWSRNEIDKIAGQCRKEYRTDGNSVIFVDISDKHIKTEEYRLYILKKLPTKVLLKEYKRKIGYVYKGYCEMDSGPYRHSDYDYCDPRCKIIVGKFASYNKYKGHNFIFYYSLAEAKAELDMREHIKR